MNEHKEPYSMSDPFDAPSTSTGITWEDYKGALLMIRVHGFEAEINTSYGTTSAVRADVTVLDGAKEGEEFKDTLVFPKVLQSQIKSRTLVLGRLGQGQRKPGQSAPWTLVEATEADKVIGREYLAKSAPAPF